MKRFELVIACLWLSLAGAMAQVSRAAEDDRVDFARDILPIFQAKCVDCHGPDEQEGLLRLDAKTIVMQGGISGLAIIKGKAKESLLYKRLVSDDEDLRMPLDDDPLSPEQINLIRRWVDQGAVWPDGVGVVIEPAEKHWAYIKPERSQEPLVKNRAWVINPIDSFVLARLEQEGLSPSPPADRAKLLRRVYLDLLGLPPSVQQIDAFLADTSPQVYEKVVDSLLKSPHYGERWARHWLDLARYADTNGYQADQHRDVWPYRDWVIQAMNDDMPFDQFTIEQLAGDLIPNSTVEQKIATGFHRLTTCNVEAGVDPEENRVNQIIDRINTTGTVWLGTSIQCAQCHNHKYDPFTQRDFYQFFAYFNNTPLEVEGNGVTYDFVGPKMDLPLDDSQSRSRTELLKKLSDLSAQLSAITAEKAKKLPQWESLMAQSQNSPPQWSVLKVDLFKSKGGASHTLLDDHSVLVGGETPNKDTYTITARTDLKGITGFMIETLTDPSLPGEGPGRGDSKRPNFILNELTISLFDKDSPDQPQVVELHSASADFSQKGWDVAGAIDGDPKTGWAINPKFHKPHHARFLTNQPIGDGDGATLTFALQQNYGGGRTIGRLRISAMTGAPSKDSLPGEIANLLSVPASKRTAKQKKQLTDYFVGLDPKVNQVRRQVAEIQKKLDAIKPLTTLVMIEQTKPRMSAVFKRGNFLDRGEPVRPGVPKSLHPAAEDLPSDRMGLALWLVDPANPLTPRVTVNRWWAEIFGRGVVATLEDFGTQGDPPTHPMMLDWLAREFTDSGWSMKRIHKLIVMSATYQQSSRVEPAMLVRDPDNKLLARGPRFRLPAEMIRDNALAASGLLSEKMGGRPVYPPQPEGIWRHVGRNAPKYATSTGPDRYRRGIYVYWRRSAPYPSFTTFDAPDRASCVVKRPRTNTPLQALTLLNDPAYIEMAVALARRMATDHTEMTIDQKVEYGFRLCTARQPLPQELQHLEEVYQRELERFHNDPQAAVKLIGKKSGDVDVSELAAWFFIANILLNLDETITKG